ncbi:MAG: GNAT family N-acetyltransferase [Rubricella sp.]
MFRFLPETPRDAAEVEYLYDTCFAPGRTALSSYRLRERRPIAELCRIVRDEYDAVVGAIRYWPVRVGDQTEPALLLGPIAIHPTRQGEGLGGLLMTGTLETARRLGWHDVILVGDEPYYRRFGFTREAARALDYPPPTNPERLLALKLAPGTPPLSGLVQPWPEQVIEPPGGGATP